VNLQTFASRTRARLAAAAAAALLSTLAAAQVATPAVTGPVPALGPPGTDLTRNYPQLASEPNFDLSRRGYVEEEYFFEGTATRYSTPAMANGVAVSSGHPYKTRLIVRRPDEAAKFNGVVIVEWVNVTAGYNFDAHWQLSREYLTREGYAYVGVSAQRVGVQQPPYGLTAWSPTRYGTLDVTAGGSITDDSLSYDIFSQAGQAIRSRPELLGGVQPLMLLAVGASQSANRLTSYYNSIEPLHRVYDGYLLSILGGPFRTDIRTKMLRINTENEIAVLNQAPVRQPDSNNFRSWEIAGASHVGYRLQIYRWQLVARDALAPFNFNCDRQPLSHVPTHYVMNAGYAHLVDWVRTGRRPPRAEPIQVTSTSPTVLPRDANGHVFGGIRLAEVDAPTATNTGVNSGASFCILYGSHEPFGAAKIASLYPTHQDYVQAVRQVTNRNVRDGFVLEEDAKEIIRDARNSRVGTPNPLPIP
jgi:hypothetical protein